MVTSSFVYPASETSTDEENLHSLHDDIDIFPNISEIIPTSVNLTTNLSVQTSYFNKREYDDSEFTFIKMKYKDIAGKVDKVYKQFNSLKKIDENNYLKYFVLKQSLIDEIETLKELSKPLAKSIQLLDSWNENWLKEGVRWQRWQEYYSHQNPSSQLTTLFNLALGTIHDGKQQVIQHIDPLLSLQVEGAAIQTKINIITQEITYLIKELRVESLFDQSPPFYSPVYVDQFKTEMLDSTWQGVSLSTWFNMPFLARHGIAYSILSILFVICAVIIRNNRANLLESKEWTFLAKRPIASIFFIGSLLSGIQLELWEVPKTVALINSIVGGIACARLLDYILSERWLKQAVYSVMIVYPLTVLLIAAGTPPPIFRLYVFMASILGLIFCIRWNKKNYNNHLNGNDNVISAALYNKILHFMSLLFLLIIIIEFFGQDGIATYLFKSTIITMAIIVPMLLFFFIIRGAMKWIFNSPLVWQIKLIRNDANEYARQTGIFIEVLIIFFFLIPAILSSWQLYPTLTDAISGIMALGFNIGELRISLGLIVVSTLTLFATVFISKVIPKILLDESVSGKLIERGARTSISHLLQYFIIIVGFLIAVSMIGFDLTKVTIILGALGVGIGFGLQGIVNNFVCGLVLLFERPLREGDTIDISDGLSMGVIKKIGLRATIVQTFDNADMIIPNADLISNQVTNWTLQNRQARLSVPVGVAYGSDVVLVNTILLECAKNHQAVLKSPPPYILFMDLGDSSLNFQLRVWLADADERITVRSDLYHDIVNKFAEENIEIPFPQRDLHLRSVDLDVFKNLQKPIS
ncbi:mechanosensitive ion channel family protein [Psychromonas sp. MME1]|uniref:mechanosensitive ion channel family protein n=2 Tax=unclassified Psychromonas TaxID=2614957 RepID=UPI0034E23E11